MPHYVDSSALVKLVVSEGDSTALREWSVGRDLIASDLVRTETLRAARRHSPAALAQARLVCAAVPMIALTQQVCEVAAELDPLILRSLVALHLACALQLAHELDSVVTYDARMAEACRLLGIPVSAPTGEVVDG